MYSLIEATNMGGPDPKEQNIIKMFVEMNPLLEVLPFISVPGRSYTYNKDALLPNIGWRAINTNWTEGTGAINPETERPGILGGEVKADIYLIESEPAGGAGLKATAIRQKVQAASNEFSRSFLEGDQGVDPNGLMGLRRRLTGSQVVDQAANGGPLTLAQLNVMMDNVVGPDSSKILLMNRGVHRKLTDLVNAFGGSVVFNYDSDTFGRKIERYRGVRIAVMEVNGDGSSILGYDEDPGDAVSDCASVYCLYLDSGDGVGAFYTGKKTLTMTEMGVQQAGPYWMARMEFYVGMYIKQGRAAGRLRAITAA